MIKQRILGIDPGFGRVGYGIIEQTSGNSWKAVAYGCIETDTKAQFVDRLKDIHERVDEVIKKYKPSCMAVEELFFVKNVTTGIQVAQARGVIVLTGVENKLPIHEFTPMEVKQAMTGYGRAEKGQMQKMAALVLGIKEKVTSDDAADALAVAVTAGQSLWIQTIFSK